jgi:hypothetical protein
MLTPHSFYEVQQLESQMQLKQEMNGWRERMKEQAVAMGKATKLVATLKETILEQSETIASTKAEKQESDGKMMRTELELEQCMQAEMAELEKAVRAELANKEDELDKVSRSAVSGLEVQSAVQ